MSDADFVARLLASPAGVSLLLALEAEHRDDVPWFGFPPDSDNAAVRTATEAVELMSFGELVRRVVSAAERVGGPWNPDAPGNLARAFQSAQERSPIAMAIAARFGSGLRDEFRSGAQQWWWAGVHDVSRIGPRFGDHREVYCCGEFPWQGIWTVSDPPPEVHDDLIDVWELFPGPISRWRLPIAPNARVLEIHAPQDWAGLVATYPLIPTPAHGGWELPGPNQHFADVRDVEVASAGSAAQHGVRVAMPDWPSIAAHHDGVHLSWAGMLTTEGHVIAVPELGPGVVTMLRYWGSERTLWLNDVFGVPEPLAAPSLSGHGNDDVAAAMTDDPMRRTTDERVLTALLGRDPFTSPWKLAAPTGFEPVPPP